MHEAYSEGQIVGDWTLVELLGHGGNGEVWVARSPSDEGAIKLLHPEKLRDEYRLERFRAEIEIQMKLGHRNGVLPIVDSRLPEESKLPKSIEHAPYLVTKIADPLERALGERPTLESVVHAIYSYATTLEELHSEDICHRDIKPDNLFRLDDNWVIGDFGLASFPEKKTLTEDNQRLGPTFFIAPEMLNYPKESDGKRADVYSLAKSLWCLATGLRYPIPGHLRASIVEMRIETYIVHPRASELNGICDWATRIKPNERATISDLRRHLGYWLNPSSESMGGLDLSRLKAATVGTLANTASENELREYLRESTKRIELNLIGRAKLITDVLSGLLEGTNIELDLWNTECSDPSILNAATANQKWPSDRTKYRRDCTCGIRAFDDGGAFRCGYAIQTNEDSQANVVVGHVMQFVGESPVCIWTQNKEFLLDSAEEEQVINELVDNLCKQLEVSYETFLEAVERRRLKDDEG